MKKVVLCPIDFSETSIDSLNYAVKLAEKEHFELSVLYNFRLIQKEKDEEIVAFKRRMEREAHEKFDKLQEKFPEKVKRDCRFLIEVGFLSDSLTTHVRKNNIACLVMGRNIGSMLHMNGRTPEAFLEDLGIPVIIVPDKKLTVE